MANNLKDAIQEMAEVFEEFKKVHVKRVDGLLDRVETLEAGRSGPGALAGDSRSSEHMKLFLKWIRKPGDSAVKLELERCQADMEHKDVLIGTGAAGGFAVPEEISREIGRLELKLSPVRRLVKVVQVGSNDYKELVSKRGTTSGWVGETGSRTATLTPQLRERAPTFGELYAYPQASEWSLDDIFFNVAQWLAEEVAQEFAQEEGLAVISGNGTNRPTGMLNTTPVSTADFASPERSANAYQLVTSDLTPGGVGIVSDALIDLVYTLNSAYRANATWVMNSTTAAALRKLKDSQSRFLWADGLETGQPNRLLGYPVETWEDMPAIGANNFPVAFGDFRRGYVLAERVGIRILEDPYTNPGYRRFYVRRRVGGHVLDNHAIKFLQTV